MSTYRPGHDTYIDYGAAHSEGNPEEQVYGTHGQNIHHGGSHGQGLHDPNIQHPQHSQIPVYATQHSMSQQHQSPQYGPDHGMIYTGQPQMGQPSSSMGLPSGIKRQRPPELDDGQGALMYPGPPQMGSGSMTQHSINKRQRPLDPGMMMEGSMRSGGMPSMPPPNRMPTNYEGPPYHGHTMPPTGEHLGTTSRSGEGEYSSGPSGSGPSLVGTAGMPLPAKAPRGPKLKFTPEDDGLLVDLKENKSLTWKQIAEFFPGRTSGTLQVRYCTKLKAKTTQWTDETVQKLRTALHDYEQEKWRIVSQKVGTGFTAAACKEKAAELSEL